MARTVTSYFFLTALLSPAAALAAPVAAPSLPACAAPASGSPVATRPAAASDIDYAALNQHLTHPDARQRVAGLRNDLQRLAQSPAPEAALVRHRLLYALTQAQAGLGQYAAARATLKQLPVSSPQAPEALVLMAELEIASGNTEAAVRWLRQMADLFPDESLSVTALWRAAELRDAGSPQALALWQQAARLADAGLASAQRWQAQSQQPGFLDTVDNDKLSPELWHLARTTLASPDFASADAVQAEARRQLQCLTTTRQAQLQVMDRNPRLLADLDATVATLAAQLRLARDDLPRREGSFLDTARRLRECKARGDDCSALKEQHDAQGRELTGWRNRVLSLESKLDFLRRQETRLGDSAAVDRAGTAVASQLGDRLGERRGFMLERLQASLAEAMQTWEVLSAQAHYKLAIAQETHVDPAAMPARAEAEAPATP